MFLNSLAGLLIRITCLNHTFELYCRGFELSNKLVRLMPNSLNKSEKPEKTVFFISDAHLSFADSPTEPQLVRFIQGLKGRASHLYILGDLFDFWFEYRRAVPASYLGTLAALLSLTQSRTKIIYLPGNHDFWLGDYLTREVGIQIAADTLDISHQGRKIHLIHGDGLAYGDKGYRLLKKIFRCKLNIWLYRLLPVDFAYWLALKTSRASRQYTSGKAPDLQGYYDYAAVRLKDGYDAVIMGHTHIPEVKHIRQGLYINTGDWIKHFSFVELKSGQFELKYFADDDKSGLTENI